MPTYWPAEVKMWLTTSSLKESTTPNAISHEPTLGFGLDGPRKNAKQHEAALHNSDSHDNTRVEECPVQVDDNDDNGTLGFLGESTPFKMAKVESAESWEAPRALVLHVSLGRKAHNACHPQGYLQELKVEVFFNGMLASIWLLNKKPDPYAGRVPLQGSNATRDMMFSGTRISQTREHPWVIMRSVATQNCAPQDLSTIPSGLRMSASGQESTLCARWEQICVALDDEANHRGVAANTTRPPSAVFLKDLAKMAVPNAYLGPTTSHKYQFGVLDIVITSGVLEKQNPNLLSFSTLRPMTIIDPRYKSCGTRGLRGGGQSSEPGPNTLAGSMSDVEAAENAEGLTGALHAALQDMEASVDVTPARAAGVSVSEVNNRVSTGKQFSAEDGHSTDTKFPSEDGAILEAGSRPALGTAGREHKGDSDENLHIAPRNTSALPHYNTNDSEWPTSHPGMGDGNSTDTLPIPQEHLQALAPFNALTSGLSMGQSISDAMGQEDHRAPPLPDNRHPSHPTLPALNGVNPRFPYLGPVWHDGPLPPIGLFPAPKLRLASRAASTTLTPVPVASITGKQIKNLSAEKIIRLLITAGERTVVDHRFSKPVVLAPRQHSHEHAANLKRRRSPEGTNGHDTSTTAVLRTENKSGSTKARLLTDPQVSSLDQNRPSRPGDNEQQTKNTTAGPSSPSPFITNRDSLSPAPWILSHTIPSTAPEPQAQSTSTNPEPSPSDDPTTQAFTAAPDVTAVEPRLNENSNLRYAPAPAAGTEPPARQIYRRSGGEFSEHSVLVGMRFLIPGVLDNGSEEDDE